MGVQGAVSSARCWISGVGMGTGMGNRVGRGSAAKVGVGSKTGVGVTTDEDEAVDAGVGCDVATQVARTKFAANKAESRAIRGLMSMWIFLFYLDW